jgi:hypothetical protein
MSLPLPKVPEYETKLPVSEKKVKYRPFLVMEEKIFLLANESADDVEIMSAIKQILGNCTFNKIDIMKLPVADIEYLFIQIRKRSVGESISSTVKCPACEAKIDYPIDLNSVEVINEIKDRNVRVSDDTLITMKYPTLDMTENLEGYKDVDIPLAVVANMVEMITIGETVYDAADFKRDELIVWLEHLSKKQIVKLEEFLADLPKVAYVDQIKCKCGNDIDIYMEGLENFFV